MSQRINYVIIPIINNERAQVVVLSSFTIETEEMLTLIRNNIQHSYIEKYIEKPHIDKEKLYILTTLFNHLSVSNDEKKQYIITTMLVQIALDTHELVPNESNDGDRQVNRTKEQLYVLAGDYYSGLYYALLADIKDVEMIRILATTIKEINEYKMKLYYQEYASFSDFINIIDKIETLLITRVAKSMNERFIIPLLEAWVTLNRWIREIEKINTNQHASVFDYWLKTTNNNVSSISPELDVVINKKIQTIESLLDNLPFQHRMLEPLKCYIQQNLKRLVHNHRALVEEG